jgi:hypothetical protein
MAITSEMMPELVDPSGFDKILQTGYEPYHAQQLAQWGLPIRPAMGVDRRRRQQYADDILAQNELANNLRAILSQGQLDNDRRQQDFDLAENINSSLDTGNDSAMSAVGPNQEILSDPDAFDAIVSGGDITNRSKTQAEANKAQAEADTEQQRADAATIAAQNSGSSNGPQFELEYNSNGDLIGFKQKGKGIVPTQKGNPTPTTSIYDEGNNGGQVELPSSSVTGRRLIRNSDGSGVIVEPDGTKVPVSKENMAKYGL